MIYKNDIANLESDIRDKIGQKIIVKGWTKDNCQRIFRKE